MIQNEEQHLRKIFPEYAAYAARVPALIPRLPAAPRKDPEKDPEKNSNPFHGSLYLKNQEFQAGLGFLAGMLFLLWKLLG